VIHQRGEAQEVAGSTTPGGRWRVVRFATVDRRHAPSGRPSHAIRVPVTQTPCQPSAGRTHGGRAAGAGGIAARVAVAPLAENQPFHGRRRARSGREQPGASPAARGCRGATAAGVGDRGGARCHTQLCAQRGLDVSARPAVRPPLRCVQRRGAGRPGGQRGRPATTHPCRRLLPAGQCGRGGCRVRHQPSVQHDVDLE
jgi:hypothetical protein